MRYSEPQSTELEAPFVVHAVAGERVVGEHLDVTVSGVRAAERLVGTMWPSETAGIWLIVDAEIAAVRGNVLPRASLRIGGREWDATDRAGTDALDGVVAAAGLPRAGSILFELPANILDDAHSARIVLGPSLDARLDEDAPYDFESLFLVPDDGAENVVVEVSVYTLPEVLRHV